MLKKISEWLLINEKISNFKNIGFNFKYTYSEQLLDEIDNIW